MESDPNHLRDPYKPVDENLEPPDLECAICFCQFNNVFNTPKILQCKHTFCLECLARMNVKSTQPDTIQCPLCRAYTPLPDLGLPKLANDSTVLSYLPTAMQHVYSIRFNRNKGKLQVKRVPSSAPVLTQTVSQTLDVGNPAGSEGQHGRDRGYSFVVYSTSEEEERKAGNEKGGAQTQRWSDEIREKQQDSRRRKQAASCNFEADTRLIHASISDRFWAVNVSIWMLSLHPKSPQTRKSKRRKSRVLFPNDTLIFKPKKERSGANPFLLLFIVIVFIQVYNAIENLDDHVLKYDLEGLERSLHREVFGQQKALEELMDHLNDYLSTYAHQQPLALSLHGASGIGKSHLGRLLARHFRSVIDDKLVVHYLSKHQCPLQDAAKHCASKLAQRISEVVTRAEEEEQIPFFILDEVELMPPPLLDTLQVFLKSNQTNEFLNVVYVFLSTLGQREITAQVLQNASTAGAHKPLREALSLIHPIWTEPAVELIPLSLLEREHVIQCFLEEMTLEGFYPDLNHVERLADELAYHTAAGKQYAKTGCKQVVGKVNQL
ncbi:hypothetical protein Q8A67_003093 [Cirrhinus molitorella]|uniref:RING-type domain-containing protein n=1 Tax=Cirrhinus molitorella TaxID=172907 RepID=A0AA88QA43_9TELE|nr:hypothetical protein Q8A67_003093 [Cirrhinus molitorella]